MKDAFELVIDPTGKIETLYQDGIEDFAASIGANISSICRLTNVEWDADLKGWTVRLAVEPRFALRQVPNGELFETDAVFDANDDMRLTVFSSREFALLFEERFSSVFIKAAKDYEAQKAKDLRALEQYIQLQGRTDDDR